MAQSPHSIDPNRLTGPYVEKLKEHLFSARIYGAEVRMPLPTPEAALSYAESVINATQWPTKEYEAEAPFIVQDMGEAWKVSGTNYDSPMRFGAFAPIQVLLRKSDATVLSYGQTMKDGSVAPPLRPPGSGQKD